MSKKSQNKDIDKHDENFAAPSESVSEAVAEKPQSKAEATRAASSTMFFLPPEQTQSQYHKLRDLERRLERIERKVNSNERFARTLAKSVTTQTLAADSLLYVLRKSLREDVEIRDELTAAIKQYDKRKFRRWFSGFFGIVLWIASVAAAAGVGAFIYWAFSGK